MKTLTEGDASASATRISRNFHAPLSGASLKSLHKIRGTVPAHMNSLMEPSALFNHAVTCGALPLLLILAILFLSGLGLVQTAGAADVLISSKAAPETGTFYRLQGPGPLPFNRFPELPLYVVDWNKSIFLIDDRSVDYEQLNKAQMAQAQAEGAEDGPEGNPPPPRYDYSTNVLWIEILGVTNNLAYLTLHNTRSNFYYQLLSKFDLYEPQWSLGEVILNDAGSNQIYFTAVTAFPYTNQFFRGVEGSAALALSYNQDAIEPSSTNSNDGQIGVAFVTRYQPVVTPDNYRVVCRIGGSAVSGVDYTNLITDTNTMTGSVTLNATDNPTNIVVDPYADNTVEFEETVTLRLLLTNGYVIYPDLAATTIVIRESYAFEPVAILPGPIGIDYHAPSNSLIVSYNYDDSGQPYNFARIYTNIVVSNSVVVTNVVITNWSRIAALTDEVKLATVKTNLGGFTNGDMYFSSGTGIGWLSANGSVSNLNWCILTNAVETNALPIRGGLYVDQTEVFSNQLIAVTSPGSASSDKKGVWRVDANGQPTMIANIDTPHLEGVITLTNDVQKWGPWAGNILTGDEDAVDENFNPRPLIYTIATNGVVTTNDTLTLISGGIHPEDFDVIRPNQDLYCVNYHASGDSWILKLSARWLTNYWGDLLITDAGEAFGSRAKLFIVSWNNATTNFVTRSITLPDSIGGRFEHVTFAPIILPALTQ